MYSNGKTQLLEVDFSTLKWMGTLWYFDIGGQSLAWILARQAILRNVCIDRQVWYSTLTKDESSCLNQSELHVFLIWIQI